MIGYLRKKTRCYFAHEYLNHLARKSVLLSDSGLKYQRNFFYFNYFGLKYKVIILLFYYKKRRFFYLIDIDTQYCFSKEMEYTLLDSEQGSESNC